MNDAFLLLLLFIFHSLILFGKILMASPLKASIMKVIFTKIACCQGQKQKLGCIVLHVKPDLHFLCSEYRCMAASKYMLNLVADLFIYLFL